MTNLPKNPKPNYEGKNESIIDKKSARINSKKILPALIRIMKSNKKLEKELKMEMNASAL